MPVGCAPHRAWEHEDFAEEQARWERSDPAYARICEEVRQTREKGEEASRRAEEAKATWDARVAAQRQANDDAEKAHHGSKSKADQTPETPNGELTGGLAGAAFLPGTTDHSTQTHTIACTRRPTAHGSR